MQLDGEAPEGVGEDVADGVIQVVVAVILEGVAVVEQPFARIAEGLEEPMLGSAGCARSLDHMFP